MGIAIFFVVLIVIAIVLFFVMRSGGTGAVGTLLGADALRAKFGASATTPEASTP